MTCGDTNPLVAVLAVLFGVGAWVSVNGIWVELPLLVELPEGWALPSYLSVIIQIANVGPITYSVTKILCPSTRPSPCIYGILAIGCVASLFLALFWDQTTVIAGSMHSTALLILIFFLSLVDCTSSVLYLPYMGMWKNVYLPFYAVGEGLSGLLPALVALVQGVGTAGSSGGSGNTTLNGSTAEPYDDDAGSEPNFSVTVFFFILFGMMVLSALAFTTLDLLPQIQFARAVARPATRTQGTVKRASYSAEYTLPKDVPTSDVISNKIHTISCHVSSQGSHKARREAVILDDPPSNGSDSSNSITVDENGSFQWPKPILSFLLTGQLLASMLTNGFLPAVQSYSCGPYGSSAYHLAATLSAFANPCAALTTALVRRCKPVVIAVLLCLGTGFAAYLITTAAMSPHPPLVGTTAGSVLVVLCWIAFSFVLSYVRVEINNLLRLTGGMRGGEVLFWSGVATQTGSFVGAVTAFLLVNVARVFTS